MSPDRILRVERLPSGHRHALPDARRAEPATLARDIETVSHSPVVAALLEAADATLLVLNARRQIVAQNGRGLGIGGAPPGSRPGEAFGCVNASAAAGCGTARACEICGALGAILGCHQRGRAIEAECLLRTDADSAALELNVRATPIVVEGHPFTVVSLRDISSEKRRQVLEQVFFHDVLNTVAGLRGWAVRFRRSETDHWRAGERIDVLSRQLEREIRDHRALLLAERGELVPVEERFRAADLLRDLELVSTSLGAARERRLEIEPPDPELELRTDPALLLRVLLNMVRNALEATPPGGAVRVRLRPSPGGDAPGDDSPPRVRFTVQNAGAIPPDVQHRIFQRSFSTKAERGRGLGTYSTKLLGERYLGGEVSFASDEERGTAFWISIPVRPPPAPERSTVN